MTFLHALPEAWITHALHPRRRIGLFQRQDGHFTFAEQYFYADDGDGEGWVTLRPQGVFLALDSAEAAARAEFADLIGT